MLRFMGSQRVRHDSTTFTLTFSLSRSPVAERGLQGTRASVAADGRLGS